MKKFLLIFMVIDFTFVGIVLKFSYTNHHRGVASDPESINESEGLTTGQKNKIALVQTFQFQKLKNELRFKTDKLQMICETSSLIELRFFAQNIAIAGSHPMITNTYSCENIKKNQAQDTLITDIDDFKKMHQQKILNLGQNRLQAFQVYADEYFPTEWKLAEIKISGPNTFTVNEFEIERVLFKSFDFELTSVK
jgi:hypothetical protein